MPTFRCNSCGQVLNLSDRRAGIRIRCPKCSHEMRAPKSGSAATGSTEPDADLSTSAIMSALLEEVSRSKSVEPDLPE
ncbi:MAG: hypothetical protein PHU85_11310, partial [Phycisphaerae bacterium]|nr:hypothetical protein [Phycisphaerae bacterium]